MGFIRYLTDVFEVHISYYMGFAVITIHNIDAHIQDDCARLDPVLFHELRVAHSDH